MIIKGYHFPDRVWVKDSETELWSSHEPEQADIERRKGLAETWKQNSIAREELAAQEELS